MNEIQVIGGAEINRKLFLFEDKLARKVLKQSLAKAGRPIVQTIKGNIISKIKKRKGKLLRSIGMWFYGNDNVIYIGPRTGRRSTKMKLADGNTEKADAWYAHFLEFGTSGHGKRNRVAGKTLGYAKKGGGITARPFMRPAWDKHKESAQEDLRRELKLQLGL